MLKNYQCRLSKSSLKYLFFYPWWKDTFGSSGCCSVTDRWRGIVTLSAASRHRFGTASSSHVNISLERVRDVTAPCCDGDEPSGVLLTTRKKCWRNGDAPSCDGNVRNSTNRLARGWRWGLAMNNEQLHHTKEQIKSMTYSLKS